VSRPFRSRRIRAWLSGRWPSAKLLSLRNPDRDDLLWQARLRLDAGAIDEASRLYDLARSLWPTSLPAILGSGACRQLSGRLDDAIALFGEALLLDPNNPYAFAGRAECRLLAGRPDEARDDLVHARDAQADVELRRRIDALHALAIAATETT
jgi:tetratricopeptide (TPR) repeat protein